MSVNVRWFGAAGDGATDDTGALQAALDAAAGDRIEVPAGTYRITAPLVVSWRGTSVGGGEGSQIVNQGRGPALIVRADRFRASDLGLLGSGSGPDAHGIEFDGARHWRLLNVTVQGHGGHGLYLHGGVWCGSVIGGISQANGGDGLHSVSPSGLEQNGNALSLLNTAFLGNGGNGLAWNAAGLNVLGCTFEGNAVAGILLTVEGCTNSARSAYLAGNYCEANGDGQIRLRSTSTHIVTGVVIVGNYLYGVNESGARALIVADGGIALHRNIEIGINHYAIAGSHLTAWVDLGNLVDRAVVYGGDDSSKFVNLGKTALHSAVVPTLATGAGKTVDDVIAALQQAGIVAAG